ncbi:hypothetical protein [Clostridium oryzae]|uniref:DUF5348 domain-containing protein n=1 Tax=Clostridium oryzae TaxID=1450648 RepID=A0A1V4I733_9CLOT|nr:hypothetical protein [Clostridium oryzae]OPJ55357.1 hypothetical protein CLORY_44230 [Clostridium oryzae]
MPMRVKVNGVVGKIINSCGKFKTGDTVNIIKLKISEYDFYSGKAYVSDGEGCYWVDVNNIKLMPGEG